MKYNPVTPEDVSEFFPDGISAAHLSILTLAAYARFAVDWGFYTLFTRVSKLGEKYPYIIYGWSDSDVEYVDWLYTRLNEWAETLSADGAHQLTYGTPKLNVR